MDLVTLDLGDRSVQLRRAVAADLPAIVALLADDALRAPVESTDPADRERYDHAFRAIDADRDAHRFYERLGFVASHTGSKLAL